MSWEPPSRKIWVKRGLHIVTHNGPVSLVPAYHGNLPAPQGGGLPSVLTVCDGRATRWVGHDAPEGATPAG